MVYRFGSGIGKHNKDAYVETLKQGLKRFIEFAEEYGLSKEKAFEIYKQSKESGEDINWKEFTWDIMVYNHKELAEHLYNHLDEIGLHIHEFCFPISHIGTTVYPGKMMDILHQYRKFCYKNSFENPEKNFCSLEEQNEQARNYVHFDFSVKKIKTLKDLDD